MTAPIKIFYASSEVAPFAKTGGLADVAGALPKALKRLGCDIRVILPYYRCINKNGFKLNKITTITTNQSMGHASAFDLYEYPEADVPTYFVEKSVYFDRDELYGTAEGDYQDNAYRFGFFSKAVLAVIKALEFKCDIIHSNDWQTALIPFYLKYKLGNDIFYNGVKTLYTIHNLAYQGQFTKDVMHDLDIPKRFFNLHDLEFYGKANFMKSGIIYSDAVSTVSKGYAKEILTEEFGCGLEGLLKTKENKLFGITNGVDYSEWNPKIDPYIKERYDADSIEKKINCKKDLLSHLKMDFHHDRPLLGVITRLAKQKGIDLLADIVKKLVESNAGIVLLGKGDEFYQNLFIKLKEHYPDRLSVNIKFDNELAHKIEAGCDMFLMPSRYEPCGLNQMYSLRYGTIPIVRATGGLDDVIIDFGEDRESGNGFKFEAATSEAFYEAVERAFKVFLDKESWEELVKKVMQLDFSWDHSAKDYIALYEKIINSRRHNLRNI